MPNRIHEIDQLRILKHIPQAFEWNVLNPDQMVEEKRKKNQTVKVKLSELDLKKAPILLRDGDHIGVFCMK